MKGYTKFSNWGFTINEGAGPINLTLIWRPRLFVYVYFFGLRWYRFFGKRT
ncbi:hypothetical protein SAMN05428966_10261 [Massilia sp. PDC64]|nr:hypothetical protein [Massilia sp. PDC64]SDC66048.1 hypothetical protein SAMN05428966_10261 [Massilia sp. PDC64]